jgi:hypothetical protein
MEYNRIVAVTGMPGLYEVITSKADGAIVKGLEDKATKFVSSRIHNLSHLESIEVYTVRENVVLSDIFMAMKNSGSSLPDVKDNNALRSYFEKVYPDLDFERVYASDMKKMIKWFEVLEQNQVDYTPKPQEEIQEEEPQPVVATPKEEKKEKKAAAKKEEPIAKEEKKPQKKAEVSAEAKEPAKKTATKKAAPKKAAKEEAPKKAAKKAAPKKGAKKK